MLRNDVFNNKLSYLYKTNNTRSSGTYYSFIHSSSMNKVKAYTKIRTKMLLLALRVSDYICMYRTE